MTHYVVWTAGYMHITHEMLRLCHTIMIMNKTLPYICESCITLCNTLTGTEDGHNAVDSSIVYGFAILGAVLELIMLLIQKICTNLFYL